MTFLSYGLFYENRVKMCVVHSWVIYYIRNADNIMQKINIYILYFKLFSFQISWVRRRDWHILTSGKTTYTNDERFHVLHADGSDDWTLQIKFVQKRDNGTYECQVCNQLVHSKACNDLYKCCNHRFPFFIWHATKNLIVWKIKLRVHYLFPFLEGI